MDGIQPTFDSVLFTMDGGSTFIPPPIPPTPPVPPVPPVSNITGVTRTAARVILKPKKQGETLPESFNFSSALVPTETLTSAVTSCGVFSGNDRNAASVLVGATSVSGSIAIQKVTGGIVGVIYELQCTVQTSFKNIVAISAFLAIEPDVPG